MIEVRPTYLIMVTPDNHNKVYNAYPEGDTFRVEYGRVDSPMASTRYPMSRWEKQISSKLKKGYQDVTDLRADLIAEVPKDESHKQIENAVIREIVDKLQSMARETISRNYRVSSSKVTQAMVDAAQDLIDDMATHTGTVGDFNEILMKLFTTIPRKMQNVSSYVAKTTEDIPVIVKREQDLLDVMRGQIYVKPAVTESSGERSELTILDEFGLTMEETTPEDVARIKSLMNESAPKFRRAWRITNKATQERFDQFVQDNNIKDTRLLFHGSRNENWWSIAKTGLMIRPSNAVYTGSMFGDGVYFAPKCQKSVGYTSLSGSYWARGGEATAYMALFEVAYGTPHVIYQHDSNCYGLNYDVLQRKTPKCHCLHAKADKGMLRNDEIVFYRTDQMTIKYLIEIG